MEVTLGSGFTVSACLVSDTCEICALLENKYSQLPSSIPVALFIYIYIYINMYIYISIYIYTYTYTYTYTYIYIYIY